MTTVASVGINFTDRSHRILETALRTAQSCRSAVGVDTSHILYAVLISDEASIPIAALQNLCVDLIAFRSLVLSAMAPKAESNTSFLPVHTPYSLDALKEAAEYAKMFGHPYVGAEHILLGLLSNVDSIAFNLISVLSVTAKDIQREVVDLLGVDYSSLIAKKAAQSTTTSKLHLCKASSPGDGYGEVICEERADGTLRSRHGEYGSRVNFCPVCGYKAKIAIADLIPYPADAPPPRTTWRHWKGDLIPVSGMARHSETKEPFVVYTHLGEDWVRPLAMWHDTVDGGVPRFRLVGGP